MWHKSLSLPNPKVIRVSEVFPPWSFYGIHIAPIISLVSALSFALPLDRVETFALYSGTSQGLLGFFMYRILNRWWFTPTPVGLLFATILSISFALNGLAISIASYPHFEIIIPALLLGSLYFLLEGRNICAAITTGLALLVREDAGFQLVALLGVLITFNYFNGVSLRSQKWLCVFLAIAFLYSCMALGAQRLLFPSFDTFTWVYGNPPSGHETLELIAQRSVQIGKTRGYLWIPLVLMGGAAILFRAPYVIVGIIAPLPWLCLQLLAHSEIAGTLQAYYAYPVMLSLGWVAVSLAPDAQHSTGNQIARTGFFRVVIAATFVTNAVVPAFFAPAFLLRWRCIRNQSETSSPHWRRLCLS
jgi:uncharacterized membrane protein